MSPIVLIMTRGPSKQGAHSKETCALMRLDVQFVGTTFRENAREEVNWYTVQVRSPVSVDDVEAAINSLGLGREVVVFGADAPACWCLVILGTNAYLLLRSGLVELLESYGASVIGEDDRAPDVAVVFFDTTDAFDSNSLEESLTWKRHSGQLWDFWFIKLGAATAADPPRRSRQLIQSPTRDALSTSMSFDPTSFEQEAWRPIRWLIKQLRALWYSGPPGQWIAMAIAGVIVSALVAISSAFVAVAVKLQNLDWQQVWGLLFGLYRILPGS